jgi:thioredoxin reductase (NADPH)
LDARFTESWSLGRQPYFLETSVTGLFAAFDVRHASVKRCASAVGGGRDGRHVRTSFSCGDQ